MFSADIEPGPFVKVKALFGHRYWCFLALDTGLGDERKADRLDIRTVNTVHIERIVQERSVRPQNMPFGVMPKSMLYARRGNCTERAYPREGAQL